MGSLVWYCVRASGLGRWRNSYDEMNQLTGVDYSDATPDVAYTYNQAGEKTAMTDQAGTVGYTYDGSGRITAITRGQTGFSYGYDTAGRLAVRTYPDGTTTSYSYDNDSRLATATTGQQTTGFSYDQASQLTATSYPNGWTETRTYDHANRITDIRSTNNDQTLAAATYTRDPNGNPTTITRDGQTETYGYDDADRVTGACYGAQLADCPTDSLISYAYDPVGNRTTQTKNGTTTTYAYDAADQLTSTTSGGTTTPYSYDQDGHQTAEGSTSYSYDLAGRLTQTTTGSTTVGFSYDGDGNRLTKTVDSVTTDYWWDDNNDLPLLAVEQQGSTAIREYHYADRLLSVTTSGGTSYYHHDTLNSTAAITDSAGAIEWTYAYTPYGEPRQTTQVDPNAPDNPIQYTGQLIDPETGLYDLRARTYNPADGGFLTTDPLDQELDDPALSNYLYAAGDPLLLSDPSGERPIVDNPNDFVVWTPNPGSGTAVVVFGGANGGGPVTANQDIVHPAQKLVRAAAYLSNGDERDPRVTTRQLAAGVYANQINSGALPLSLLDRADRRDLYVQFVDLARDLDCAGTNNGNNAWGTYCNQVVSAQMRAEPPFSWGQFAHDLSVLSGWADLVGCAHGKTGSCAFTALLVLGWAGRGGTVLADLDRLGRAADSLGSAGRWVRDDFRGARVYQRDALIDPSRVDRLGRTNLERMQKGLAPIGPDGNPINLHHLTQSGSGPVAEVTQSFHQRYSSVLHINPNSVPSGIDRSAFAVWRSQYWKVRAKAFG